MQILHLAQLRLNVVSATLLGMVRMFGGFLLEVCNGYRSKTYAASS
jgi:hypothetical protein